MSKVSQMRTCWYKTNEKGHYTEYKTIMLYQKITKSYSILKNKHSIKSPFLFSLYHEFPIWDIFDVFFLSDWLILLFCQIIRHPCDSLYIVHWMFGEIVSKLLISDKYP